MRRPHSRLRVRRQAHAQERRPDLRRGALASRMRLLLERMGWRVYPAPAAGVLVLLAAAAVLLSGAAPGPHAGAAGVGAVGAGTRQQLAGAPRSGARWIDPADATAFALTLLESPGGVPGTFTFTLPTGDVIRGQSEKLVTASNSLPLFALIRELTQLDPTAPFDAQSIACGFAQVVPAGSQTKSTPQAVDVALGVHVGQGGLIAYAGLAVLPVAVVAGPSGCALGSPAYEVKAGCASMTTCAPLGTPTQALGQYDQAIVSAARSGDWSTVYTLTGQAVTAQYTESEFAAAMRQQVQRVGRITTFGSAEGSPAIQLDAAGQAYFKASQAVILDKNGQSSTRSVVSYYLLESGTWKLWFSCLAGSC